MAITYGNATKLDLLHEINETRIVIGARARREVSKPPAQTQLRRLIEGHVIDVESIDLAVASEQQALIRFDQRPALRGRGEAESWRSP